MAEPLRIITEEPLIDYAGLAAGSRRGTVNFVGTKAVISYFKEAPKLVAVKDIPVQPNERPVAFGPLDRSVPTSKPEMEQT